MKHLNTGQIHSGPRPERREAAKDGTAAISTSRHTVTVDPSFHPGPRHETHRMRSHWTSSAGSHQRGACRRAPVLVGRPETAERASWQLNDDGVAHAEVPTSTVRPRSIPNGRDLRRSAGPRYRLEAQTSLAPQATASSKYHLTSISLHGHIRKPGTKPGLVGANSFQIDAIRYRQQPSKGA